MRPRKNFLYFLNDPQGRSYWRNGYNNLGRPKISPSTTPRWLDSSPIGWEDNGISFGRNKRLHGINRSFTIPLKFVNDGAEILRSRLYGKGYEDRIKLNINKWAGEAVDGTATDDFNPYYGGEIDLTKIEDEIDGVTANVMEGGADKYLNSNENVKYEIRCDETNPDVIQVLNDGMNFIDKLHYITGNNPVSFNNTITGQTWATVNMAYRDNDTANFGVIKNENPEYQLFDPSDIALFLATSPNYTIYADKQIEAAGIGELIWNQTSSPGTFTVSAFFYTSNGVTYPIATNITLSSDPVNPTVTPFNVPMTLEENEKVFLIVSRTSGAGTGIFGIQFLEGTFIDMQVTTRNDASTCYGVRPLDVWKQLVSKATEGKYTGDSNIFTDDNNKVLTCGDALKNSDRAIIPNYVMSMSINDFFKTYDGIYMAAISVVDGVIRLDTRGTVYNSSTVTMNVGEVSGSKVSVWEEMLVNNIKYGYPDQNYGNKAGRYEYNSSAESKMPVATVSRDYDITTIFRADAIGIEFIRSKFTVIDASSPTPDKEVFILAISDDQDVDGNYLLGRPATAISGTFDDTAYNYVISPKRNLLAHGAWLRSLAYFLPASRITFQTAIKNAELSTTIGGITVAEKSNVRIDSLAAPLFYPYVFTFKTKVPLNFIDIMTGAINGHIAFQINGRQFYGFPLEVSVKPALDEEQTWQVLASTMNDLSQLQDLEPDPLNNLDMSTYNMSRALLCPVQFIPMNEFFSPLYHQRSMDGFSYTSQIEEYAQKTKYLQKWQNDDPVDIQCFTNGLGPVQVDIINCHGQNFGTTPLTQKIDGAVAAPYALFEGSVSLQDLDEGVYYMILTAGTGETIAQFISEPFHVKEDWPLTLLYKYKHSRNRASTIFSTGYYPSLRVEGAIVNFNPGAKYTSYEDEPLDMEVIEGIPFRKFTLKAGENVLLPPYMVDKLNRIMCLDTTHIDGVKYARASEEFEVQRFPGVPGAFWGLEIRQGINNDAVTVGTDGQLQNNVVVVYNIETKFFGDLAGQVSSNVVQVERVEEQL